MRDEWLPIPGFPKHEISKNGLIRSYNVKGWVDRRAKRPVIIRHYLDKDGYRVVTLSKDNRSYRKHVHGLILLAFVGPRPDGYECGHLNGIPDDNRLSNLKWISRKENSSHRILHGTHCRGSQNPASKLKERDVLDIMQMWDTGKFTRKEIADKYNLHPGSADHIIYQRGWKHLTSKWNKKFMPKGKRIDFKFKAGKSDGPKRAGKSVNGSS